MGYRVDAGGRAAPGGGAEASGGRGEDVAVCVHDSCPDRSTGEFADGARALLPGGVVVESGARAQPVVLLRVARARGAGKLEAGDKQARRHGEEAEAAGMRRLW